MAYRGFLHSSFVCFFQLYSYWYRLGIREPVMQIMAILSFSSIITSTFLSSISPYLNVITLSLSRLVDTTRPVHILFICVFIWNEKRDGTLYPAWGKSWIFREMLDVDNLIAWRNFRDVLLVPSAPHAITPTNKTNTVVGFTDSWYVLGRSMTRMFYDFALIVGVSRYVRSIILP